MQRKYRLKSGRVFDYLHRKGVSSANKRLVLVHAPSKYPLKVGFIVSKKVGKAVVRNKVRRRLREIFRALIPFLDENRNYIIIARAESANSTFAQLANSLAALLQKAGLIVKPLDTETATRLSLGERFFSANGA
ncbi:MAG: ribonuclease P protein component [Clostridia bacterium]|nr:ribonuclease P protein component [Clostridia bacterium]MDE7216153.1 ribonuclease P protein component [Clostridia bacterium]